MAAKRGSQYTGFIGPARDTLSTFIPITSSFTGSTAFKIGTVIDTGESFGYDPIGWMQQGRINSKVQCNVANKNHGKTSLMIAIMVRYALFNMGGKEARITVDDVRRNFDMGEYVKTAEFFDSLPIKFDDRLNIFDPEFGFTMSENLETALDAFLYANNGKLPTTDQAFALQVAVSMLFSDEYKGFASMEVLAMILLRMRTSDLTEYLTENLDDVIMNRLGLINEMPPALTKLIERPMNVYPEDVLKAATTLGKRFVRLLEGDFGKRFGGTVSIAKRLQQSMALIDYSGLNDKTIAFMQSFFWRVKKSAQTRMDYRYMFHLEGHDENYKFWNFLPYAEAMSEYLKQIRAYMTLVIMNTHRVRDYYSVGIENSRQRQLATNMFGDVGFWFLGKQSKRDAEDLRQLLNLEQHEADRLMDLTVGQWGVKLGNEPVIFIDTYSAYTETLEGLSRSNMANENLLTV